MLIIILLPDQFGHRFPLDMLVIPFVAIIFEVGFIALLRLLFDIKINF